MRSFIIAAAAAASAFLPTTVLAQTFTKCNALNETGCPNMPALGGNATFNFNDTLYNKIWTKQNQGKVDWSEKGARFTIERRGDSPMIQSKFYMLFGRLEVVMKAAPGQGIVSSAILQSEVLDEIDWEFLGSNNTHVLTNYFGKGNTTDYTRGKDYKMAPPQEEFHNYTIDWTKERIQWWVDGNMLRELKPEEALNGFNYPQTPMNIRLGAWSGGDVENNHIETVKWAGGETDFSKAPFTMTVQTVYAHDYTTAKEYSWENMDASGSWEKVKVIEGKSELLQEYQKPSGVRNRWAALSKGAQIAIIASIIGFVVIVAAIVLFYFIKQRRAGAREYKAHLAEADKEAAENLQYKQYQQQTPGGKFGYNRL
ncbi:glycoside hydrolase family 16 protein [Aaosphaeria arxii CBS 175.79]|uniref:chitinase n=1 Tax=Aaosphaeria arxii CBS 175.79 TaxID=1450172 RepID=A0A6A5XWH5_9PLEO|nr:glycoside hydrolase family 16 protein [Aaosphaeria arxii CBS 175.79]KAF2017522.1 glycoside hydrolase family 16 protein [Aaosphaeria arxii CBS 175.79]